MKQKLIIISVLLYNPKNWILDEPMTGLDPKASFELKNIMEKLLRQKFRKHLLRLL